MELVDVHAHMTDKQFDDDIEDVVKRAEENYVKKIISSAYDLLSSEKSISLSKQFETVYATVGIHPENVEDFSTKALEKIRALGVKEKVVAIGEIGLDYHYTVETKAVQKEAFISQIMLANKLNLPVVVHSRDAMGDTIDVLKKHTPNKESLLHCYSGSIESAKILLGLGFSFSFGGVSTFSNAKNVVDVIKFLPLEKILLETDCPYLAPVPFRGKRNEPKNIKYIADTIAKIKGVSIEEVAQITTQNAKRIFGI